MAIGNAFRLRARLEANRLIRIAPCANQVGEGGRNGKNGAGKGVDEDYVAKDEAKRSPTPRAKVKVAIQQVSIAFLNDYIKRGRFAIEWLKNVA